MWNQVWLLHSLLGSVVKAANSSKEKGIRSFVLSKKSLFPFGFTFDTFNEVWSLVHTEIMMKMTMTTTSAILLLRLPLSR